VDSDCNNYELALSIHNLSCKQNSVHTVSDIILVQAVLLYLSSQQTRGFTAVTMVATSANVCVLTGCESVS
jgi:hypothetical protein